MATRLSIVATVATTLALALLGCAAREAQAPRPAAETGAVPGARVSFYQGGRFAELEERVARTQVEAEHKDPVIVGLLLAAQGQVEAGLRLLTPQLTAPQKDPGSCLPLLVAQIQLYQRGDPAAAQRALGAGAGAGCSAVAEEVAALRAHLSALGEGPVWALSGPPDEQVLNLDRIAANAGYLVVRVIFDREHSGQFLLSTGTPDVIIDRRLAAALGLPGPGQSAVVAQVRVGLNLGRRVPVRIAELSALREKFQKRVARSVDLDGILPLQRLLPRGYFRLTGRGQVVLSVAPGGGGGAMGPCRLQYPHHTALYQQAGVLRVSGALPGSPVLLMALDLSWRRTALQEGTLRFLPAAPRVEPGESDVARPVLTEPEVTRRVAEVVLALGQAELRMRHVPLLAGQVTRGGLAPIHGVVGTDVAAELDLWADLGEGRLYLAPPGSVNCAR